MLAALLYFFVLIGLAIAAVKLCVLELAIKILVLIGLVMICTYLFLIFIAALAGGNKNGSDS
jgi:hypothetical protein